MSKRDSILQATIDVVAKHGISDSPTTEIAKEAGAAQLTVFRLFGSKKELLRQTYEEVKKRLQDNCLCEINKVKGVDQQLATLLKDGIKYYRKYPNELAYFQQYTHTLEGFLQRPDFQYENGKNISDFSLVALLDEGKKQGVFKNLPMTALVGLAGAPVAMFLRLEQIRKKEHSKSETDLLIQACSQAVKT